MSKTVLIRDEYGEEQPYTVENGVSLLLQEDRTRQFFYLHRDGIVPITDTSVTDVTLYEQAQINDEHLTAKNIKDNTTILGITGNFTHDANATANDIAAGKTAYVQGQLITGNGAVTEREGAYLSFIGCNISITPTSDLQLDGILYYSYDAQTWQEWDVQNYQTISADSILYLRGSNNTYIKALNDKQPFIFDCSDFFSVKGNIESLLDYETARQGDHPVMAAACFLNFFHNCTKLKSVSNNFLSATTLQESCYTSMFYGCSSLINAPALPATTLADFCYEGMFSDCISLTQLPTLAATTLAENCYMSMFSGCTSLENIPQNFLPAMTLTPGCYWAMFWNCHSLKNVCTLPATVLANNCYDTMFADCQSLKAIPTNLLQATSLEFGCYAYMFDGCKSLTNLPELPATTLADQCYYQMFGNCISIQLSEIQTSEYSIPYRIPVSGTGTEGDLSLLWMFDMTRGTFVGTPEINTTYYLFDQSFYDTCITLKSEDDNEISLKSGVDNIATWSGTLYYYTDNSPTWQYWGGKEISGKIICLRGSNSYLTKYNDTYGIGFKVKGNFSIKGNIENLLNYTSVQQGSHPTMGNNAFQGLFQGCRGLISIDNLILPSTTLSSNCYESMFANCTSLTSIPQDLLPAMTLVNSCYRGMFQNCSSLLNMCNLPATTASSYCYAYMFSGCRSLITLLDRLPATILDSDCYAYMFQNCISLTEININFLPAIILAAYCYQGMFSGCSSLKKICKLPATTLALRCCDNMFFACSSLRECPQGMFTATTLAEYCYIAMFTNCTSLEKPPNLPKAIWASYCYTSMFNGCTNLDLDDSWKLLGTHPGTTITNCCQSMFHGCSNLKKVPNLPYFSSNVNYGFYQMFRNCTALKTVTWGTVRVSAYGFYSIFEGCTGLESVKMNIFLNTGSQQCTGMFRDCTSLKDISNLRITGISSGSSYCCNEMFMRCSALEEIPGLLFNYASTIGNYTCYRMFNTCTSLKKIPNNLFPWTNVSSHCYDGMFGGCSSLALIPKDLLPATSLATYCYASMFQNCSSLLVLPLLPATTLATYCYYQMFYNCSNIKLSATQSNIYNTEYRIPSTGTISSTPSYAFSNMFYGTTGTKTTMSSNTTAYYYDYSLMTPTEVKYTINSELEKNQTLVITSSATRKILVDWGDKKELLQSTVGYSSYTFPTINTNYTVKIYCITGATWTFGKYTENAWSTIYEPFISAGILITEYTSTGTLLNTAIKEVVPGDGLIRIEMFGFLGSGLKKVTNWNQIQTLGAMNYIRNSNLYSVQAPSTHLTTIANATFGSCPNLLALVIPDSVTSFGANTASDTTPFSLTFNNSIRGDRNLVSMIIGSGVTTFKTNFGTDGPLNTRIICHATTPPSQVTFASTYTGKIKVPSTSLETYKAASGWSTVANNIEGTADYLYQHGDLVDTIYFNTNLDLGSLINTATLTDDLVTRRDEQTGLGYAYLGVNYLFIVALENDNYALVWNNEVDPIIPIYTTTAEGLSDWGIATAGWQMSSLTISDPTYQSNIDITSIPACFFAQMDEIIAKNPLAFTTT